MVRKTVTVECVVSPALLVQSACMYDCKTTVQMGGKQINAKSLLGMMSLTIVKGDTVEIITDGAEEEEAAAQILSSLTDNGRKAG